MTKKELSAGRLTLVLLREDHANVADGVARYRLYEGTFASAQYYVEVTFGDERSVAYLGEDAVRAIAAYEAIFVGTVTPCTLQAVASDLFG